MDYQNLYLQQRRPKNKPRVTWFVLLVIAVGIPLLFATNSIDPIHHALISFKEEVSTELEKFRLQNKNSASLLQYNQNYLDQLNLNDILPLTSRYTIEDTAPPLIVNAEAYIVGDVETGEIILAENQHKKLPIASITKLMTALVALEEIPETATTQVSVQASRTESARGMLKAHEEIGVSDLLYPLLLVSSNDAAEAIAEEGGRNSFISAMNSYADLIGMSDTSFDDPSGLSEKNISTAFDLFTLSQNIFIDHPVVFDITTLEEYTQGGRVWKNANRFTGNENYRGGKTGYTSKARRTGVALFDVDFGNETRTVAITLLKTENRIEDYQNILEFLNEYVVFEHEVVSSEEETATLAFVGDLMFDRGVKSSVQNNFNGDYTKLFDNLPMLRDADIAFGNLEGPISDKGENVGSAYSFRFPPVIASTLKEVGFDIVSFANNHIGDWSLIAFQDTLRHLEQAGIHPTGSGQNKKEAEAVDIIESKGIKIGFIGFSDVGPTWLEAGTSQAGQLLASDPKRERIIGDAKEKVDILVVSYHWGQEYSEVTDRQRDLATSSIDAGADIVVGHHPHVVQTIERYNSGIIAYSLGNAIFDQHFSQETIQGTLLEINVKKQGVHSYQEYLFPIATTYQPGTPVLQTKNAVTEIKNFSSLEKRVMEAVEKTKQSCPRASHSYPDFMFTNLTRKNSLKENFVPTNLVPVPNTLIPTKDRTLCLEKETLVAFYEMFLSAEEDGVSIVPTSGYRSQHIQSILFERSPNSQKSEEAYLSIAEPGHSEHHLGTTIDLTSSEINFESASQRFTGTRAYEWLTNHAHEYGFVQSYQEGKESLTGYIPESWHWRYLGSEHATTIHETDETIQEYLENYKKER